MLKNLITPIFVLAAVIIFITACEDGDIIIPKPNPPTEYKPLHAISLDMIRLRDSVVVSTPWVDTVIIGVYYSAVNDGRSNQLNIPYKYDSNTEYFLPLDSVMIQLSDQAYNHIIMTVFPYDSTKPTRLLGDPTPAQTSYDIYAPGVYNPSPWDFNPMTARFAVGYNDSIASSTLSYPFSVLNFTIDASGTEFVNEIINSQIRLTAPENISGRASLNYSSLEFTGANSKTIAWEGIGLSLVNEFTLSTAVFPGYYITGSTTNYPTLTFSTFEEEDGPYRDVIINLSELINFTIEPCTTHTIAINLQALLDRGQATADMREVEE